MRVIGYLDASSASVVVSAIVGGVQGVKVFIKSVGRKAMSPLRRKEKTAE